MAIETQQISASNVIETDSRVFAHPSDLEKLDLLNITQPTDIDFLLNKVNSINNPIQDKGEFDPIDSGLMFPNGALAGWMYRIASEGTIGNMNLYPGDVIFAVSNVVDRTDSSLWIKIDNTENPDILRQSILDIDGTLSANTNNKIATQKAVKSYVDNQLQSLNASLMDEIEQLIVSGGASAYISSVSDWEIISIAANSTDSIISINDDAESIIRIYIEGWGDVIDGWSHPQGSKDIILPGDVEHINKRCKVTYIVKQ
jgi:hypothetical protein